MRKHSLILCLSAWSAQGGGADWYPYLQNDWGTAVSSFSKSCSHGKAQSPVNFKACDNPINRTEIITTWKSNVAYEVANNGHTLTISPRAKVDGGTMTTQIAGETLVYTYLQCHFHWPSEHTVSGSAFDMETHCVHQLETTEEVLEYGVLGLFQTINESDPDPFFDQFSGLTLPVHSDSQSKRLLTDVGLNIFGDPVSLIHERRLAGVAPAPLLINSFDLNKLLIGVNLSQYFSYKGSFTSPPCTEGVDFYVVPKSTSIKPANFNAIKAAIGWTTAGGNFRPPQLLNSRKTYGCTDEEAATAKEPWYPYSGEKWATKVEYSKRGLACKDGTVQSPINFESCSTPEVRNQIKVTWATQKVDLFNNGHTVELQALDEDTSGKMEVYGQKFKLLQCHFHWGSEHRIAARQLPFEAHCVHKKETTEVSASYGVFGVFFELGAENSFLSKFDGQLPTKPPTRRLGASDVSANVFGHPLDPSNGRKLAGLTTHSSWDGPLDFKGLYGSDLRTNYWDYSGSLTTPPCTEAVQFYILMNPQTLTNAQYTKFSKAIGWSDEGGNFRPPQKLHGRVVAGCDETADAAIFSSSIPLTILTLWLAVGRA